MLMLLSPLSTPVEDVLAAPAKTRFVPSEDMLAAPTMALPDPLSPGLLAAAPAKVALIWLLLVLLVAAKLTAPPTEPAPTPAIATPPPGLAVVPAMARPEVVPAAPPSVLFMDVAEPWGA